VVSLGQCVRENILDIIIPGSGRRSDVWNKLFSVSIDELPVMICKHTGLVQLLQKLLDTPVLGFQCEL
jgi:hypothetical protein